MIGQFDEQNSQGANGRRYWTGTLRTNPNVAIVGSLSRGKSPDVRRHYRLASFVIKS
jgi:hypothetical protein